MFNWLKEIADNVVAEVSLATASPDKALMESVKKSIKNEDSHMCAAIEDAETAVTHGRILNDIKAAGLNIEDTPETIAQVIKWPVKQVMDTVEAQKIVVFLKKKLYEKDQIIRIGNISRALQRNGGDVQATAAECGADIDSVNAVIRLINEYAASVGGTVVWQPAVGEEKSDETSQPTSGSTKSSSKKTSSKTAAAKKEQPTKPFTVAAAGAAQ